MKRSFSQKVYKMLVYNIFVFSCIIILAIVAISLSRDFVKYQKLKKEIDSRKQDIVNIENKISELFDYIKYLDSENYAEKKARVELGMKKSDEKVAIVAPSQEEKIEIQRETSAMVATPNYLKWWNYLFKKQT